MNMYPFYAAIAGLVAAQFLKPFCFYLIHKKWEPILFFANGNMPSSHSSLVSSLTLAVGISENFSSTLFTVTLVFAVIICFDAANVRYYAGKNIMVTKRLVDDIRQLTELKLDDPIYQTKMKEVLGHTYLEVFAGILLGLTIAYLLSFVML